MSSQTLAGDEFRELLIRLDHPIDAPPIGMHLADGEGLLAIGREGDDWRFSVISIADGGIVASGIVPSQAFFYDAGDPQGLGADRVCFLDESGVSTLDPASGELSRVVDVASVYHGSPSLGPARSDFVRDVDGDEADDILVPQFEGWLLARQRGGGFDHYLLKARPRVTVYETRISYQPRLPQIGDMDGDGLNDLVFLIDTEFVSFIQESPGLFSGDGRRDQVDAPLATEKQRAQWQRDDGQIDQSELEIEEVELVKDFDGDGILDLLTDRSISEGVFNRRSEYHLYLGRRDGSSVRYAAEPDGSITSDGVQFDPIVMDVDGDGRLDIATPSTRLSVTRIVGALFSGRMGVDLNVYRMRPGGQYPQESDYRTRFKVEFDLKTGLTRYPAVAIADFDGDGSAELLLQEDADELTLYSGIANPTLFGDTGRTFPLSLPRNGQMVETRDLDGDGRSDLLVRYGPADGAERERELRMMLSVTYD
ncbi:MAG: VCBS repeat-containing protein [Gammaproteobacteria bacterium]|nr:MAG: VCBS repeat-containing protein [Gammaproteobacteria bacterium]